MLSGGKSRERFSKTRRSSVSTVNRVVLVVPTVAIASKVVTAVSAQTHNYSGGIIFPLFLKGYMEKIFREHVFTLQWHLTARCQQNCLHCYLTEEETYPRELKDEMSLAKCLEVMDDFSSFAEFMRVDPRISFTGGDPMLRKDIFSLISEAKHRGFYVGILGNPHKICSTVAERLRIAGVTSYQLSLDGLEKTHDFIRQRGSFARTIAAINDLKKVGIKVGIMMTLSHDNVNDLLPLMDLVGQLGVDSFAFARISATGEGERYKAIPFLPLEYREILLSAERKIKELKAAGVTTRYNKKCHLWKLLDFERGLVTLPEEKDVIFGGCTMGVTGLIILADGTVMACRRFPSIVGKVPEMKLFDVFIHSEKMNEFRDYSKLEKCSGCELVQICRGCPAVAYGQYGRWGAPDPQCWK